MTLAAVPVHNPLTDLLALIDKGTFEKDIEFMGKTYTFRSLFDEDYNWRDQFVNLGSPTAMLTSQRSPTLAIALVAIDGLRVNELPGMADAPSSLPVQLREFAKENRFMVAYNLHHNVLGKLPRHFIEGLFDLFIEQVEKPSKEVGAEAIKKS